MNKDTVNNFGQTDHRGRPQTHWGGLSKEHRIKYLESGMWIVMIRDAQTDVYGAVGQLIRYGA